MEPESLLFTYNIYMNDLLNVISYYHLHLFTDDMYAAADPTATYYVRSM